MRGIACLSALMLLLPACGGGGREGDDLDLLAAFQGQDQTFCWPPEDDSTIEMETSPGVTYTNDQDFEVTVAAIPRDQGALRAESAGADTVMVGPGETVEFRVFATRCFPGVRTIDFDVEGASSEAALVMDSMPVAVRNTCPPGPAPGPPPQPQCGGPKATDVADVVAITNGAATLVVERATAKILDYCNAANDHISEIVVVASGQEEILTDTGTVGPGATATTDNLLATSTLVVQGAGALGMAVNRLAGTATAGFSVLAAPQLDADGNTELQIGNESGTFFFNQTVFDNLFNQEVGPLREYTPGGRQGDTLELTPDDGSAIVVLPIERTTGPQEIELAALPGVQRTGSIRVLSRNNPLENRFVPSDVQKIDDLTIRATGTLRDTTPAHTFPGFGVAGDGTLQTPAGFSVDAEVTFQLDAARPLLTVSVDITTTDPAQPAISFSGGLASLDGAFDYIRAYVGPGEPTPMVGFSSRGPADAVGIAIAHQSGQLTARAGSDWIAGSDFLYRFYEGVQPANPSTFVLGVGSHVGFANDEVIRWLAASGGALNVFQGFDRISGVARGATEVDVLANGHVHFYNADQQAFEELQPGPVRQVTRAAVNPADDTWSAVVPSPIGGPVPDGEHRFVLLANPGSFDLPDVFAQPGEQNVDVPVAQLAELTVHVRDESGGLMPATVRICFPGGGGGPNVEAIFAEENAAYVDGDETLRAAPGVYEVIVMAGLQHAAVKRDVVLDPDAPVELTIQMTEMITDELDGLAGGLIGARPDSWHSSSRSPGMIEAISAAQALEYALVLGDGAPPDATGWTGDRVTFLPFAAYGPKPGDEDALRIPPMAVFAPEPFPEPVLRDQGVEKYLQTLKDQTALMIALDPAGRLGLFNSDWDGTSFPPDAFEFVDGLTRGRMTPVGGNDMVTFVETLTSTADGILAGVRAGNTLVTNGPIIRLRVDANQDGVMDGGPGDLVPDDDGVVDIEITVVASPWVNVDQAHLQINDLIQEEPIHVFLELEDLFSDNADLVERLRKVIAVDVAQDAAIFAVAQGASLLPFGPEQFHGATSPIFIDRDRNGVYDPPGG